MIVVKPGYSAAFLALGAVAAIGFLVFGFAFPARDPASRFARLLRAGMAEALA